jgi:hypothetical protein
MTQSNHLSQATLAFIFQNLKKPRIITGDSAMWRLANQRCGDWRCRAKRASLLEALKDGGGESGDGEALQDWRKKERRS